MHQLNVLVYGPDSFLSTLNELKPFLKFNHFNKISNINYDIILFHDKVLGEKEIKEIINDSELLKICVSNKKKTEISCDLHLQLPTTIKELNYTIENIVAKRIFNKNSSIDVKKYSLNKNEKRLLKDNKSIILTEKEVQLIELLINSKKPISKDSILSSVWNYSADADTHTVETHIYRLRKKISNEFMDNDFILNNKDGYYLWKKEINLQRIYSLQNIEKELLSQKKAKEVLREEKNSNYLFNLAPIIWITFADISVPFSRHSLIVL